MIKARLVGVADGLNGAGSDVLGSIDVSCWMLIRSHVHVPNIQLYIYLDLLDGYIGVWSSDLSGTSGRTLIRDDRKFPVR